MGSAKNSTAPSTASVPVLSSLAKHAKRNVPGQVWTVALLSCATATEPATTIGASVPPDTTAKTAINPVRVSSKTQKPSNATVTVSATPPPSNASASTTHSNHPIVLVLPLFLLGACTASSCSPGTCGDLGLCECPNGFTGPTCSPLCDNNATCSGHGICNRSHFSSFLPQRQCM